MTFEYPNDAMPASARHGAAEEFGALGDLRGEPMWATYQSPAAKRSADRGLKVARAHFANGPDARSAAVLLQTALGIGDPLAVVARMNPRVVRRLDHCVGDTSRARAPMQ